jgi:teichoic acid transport system ATP-binding protein
LPVESSSSARAKGRTAVAELAEIFEASVGNETVVLEDVHVVYRVQGDSRPKIREILTGHRAESREASMRSIHAVRGVSMTAFRGQAIGLIGRNGSGKSTLLQAMAGLLPATSGVVLATSQPMLLGVGAALQAGLSGRRNVLLGGLALGLSKAEIEGRMDEIVEFAGLEDFIDLPLKTYSSGMRARLLFSISTAVRPEILLIDEALAVGDEIFRKRSERRITELLDGAGTVFVVSHSFAAIEDICNRAIWLDQGQVQADGDPGSVLGEYKAFVKRAG